MFKLKQGTEDIFRILLTTDNHVGYLEKDGIRGNDTFKTLEEILYLAKHHNVDFILQGGDLFHENRPSIRCINEVLRLVRTYCLDENPVSFEILSDPAVNFSSTSYPEVNYLDANLNVGIPIFAIHGNHDDPSGPGNVCPPDILHTCGLLNLFGKTNSVESIEVNPVLLRKGKTKLALYGIGAMREERLHRLFRDNKVSFLRPDDDIDDWFSLAIVHQNRVRHGPTGYLPEKFLPSFLDLVFWGHEHDCRVQPEWNDDRQFYVVQPGSSVITALSKGEEIPKCVALLEIKGRDLHITKIPLCSVRKFVFEDIDLQKELPNVDPSAPDAAAFVEKLCNDRIQAAIDKTTEETSDALRKRRRMKAEDYGDASECMMDERLSKFPPPPEPLVRLRVDTSGGFEKFSALRFGQKFVGRVANPKDLIIFHNRRETAFNANAGGTSIASQPNSSSPGTRVGLAVADVESLIGTVLSSDANLQMELLTQGEMASALRQFVNREENDAISSLVGKIISKTQGHLIQKWCLEDAIPTEVSRFAETRRKSQITQEAQVGSSKRIDDAVQPLIEISPVKNEPIDVSEPPRRKPAPIQLKTLKQSTMSFGISSSSDEGGVEDDEEENRLLLESLEMVESQVKSPSDEDGEEVEAASSDFNTQSRLTSGIFSFSESQASSTTVLRGCRGTRRGRGSRGPRRGGATGVRGSTRL